MAASSDESETPPRAAVAWTSSGVIAVSVLRHPAADFEVLAAQGKFGFLTRTFV
ncbi:MAG TPA: hypothetical protein VKU60_00975 [Chloroflexota bacterium]|nr:hypothetical protein [Chloroflexota bacterium]